MYNEIFYENKKNYKREMIIVLIMYILIMFLVPYIIIHFKIVEISATRNAWLVEGNANLALLILILAEIIGGFLIGLITIKSGIYYIIVQFSFIIKFVIFLLTGVIIWFYSPFDLGSLISKVNFLVTRIIIAYSACNAIFLVPMLFCLPTLLGTQLGELVKNKYREKKLERKAYASKN